MVLDKEDGESVRSLDLDLRSGRDVIIRVRAQTKIPGLCIHGLEGNRDSILRHDLFSFSNLHSIDRNESGVVLEVAASVGEDRVVGSEDGDDRHHRTRDEGMRSHLLEIQQAVHLQR